MLYTKTNPKVKTVNKTLTIYLGKMTARGEQRKVKQGEWMTDSREQRRKPPREGGGGGERTSQYGGTLHNSLTVLIYPLAHLAPSQYAIAFVIFELEPRRRERKRKRD